MELKRLIAGTSSLVAIMLIIFMLGGTEYAVTGNIELGFPCIAGLELRAPESLTVHAGSYVSANVTVYDVKCGIEHAKLRLDGIPEDYYGVTPPYLATVAPGKEGTFTLDFMFPAEHEPMTYSPTLLIWSNQGRFIKQSIDVHVLEALEKPEVEAPQPELIAEDEVGVREHYFLNQGLAMLLLVTAILGAFGIWYLENRGFSRKL